jgi:glycine/D-amino acid oxidase-like deaminating enzyme
MIHKSDVAIVGGGLIGFLTAIELSERGARVVILEKDNVGFEQSARSVAAVNLPGGEANQEPAAGIFRVSAEQWSIFEKRWGCSIDLNDEGWFIVVADEEDQAWLEIERSTWSATAGFTESKMLSRDEARQRYPQLSGPFLGLDVRHGGHVDAVMVMNGLRQIAARLGIAIRCGVMATGFDARDGRILAIRTTEGPIGCETLVVAAGLWSPYLCDRLGFHFPLQRVRAPAVETDPMPPDTIPGFLRASSFGARQNRNGTIRLTGGYRFSAMLHDLSLSDFRDLRIWGPRFWQNRKDVSLRLNFRTLRTELDCAFRGLRLRDGVVVPQGYLPPASPQDRYAQLNGLAGLIPALQHTRISRFFSGVMDLTPDLQPLIGKIPGTANGYIASGFSGHGYLGGPGACVALAELVSDGHTDIDLSAFLPNRFTDGQIPMRKQIF